MSVKGKSQKLDVLFGPNYRAVVIFSPNPNAAPPAGRGGPPPTANPQGVSDGRGPVGLQNPNFICFEAMAGITDAINLAHRGIYKELQSVPPGGTWQESFWVRPSGF
jgi:aldose 1-epimerase